jgi:hypothetical protein
LCGNAKTLAEKSPKPSAGDVCSSITSNLSADDKYVLRGESSPDEQVTTLPVLSCTAIKRQLCTWKISLIWIFLKAGLDLSEEGDPKTLVIQPSAPVRAHVRATSVFRK